MKKSRIILIDMDGVIADFRKGFFEQYKERFPEKPLPDPISDPAQFYIEDNYPAEFKEAIQEIYRSPGFFIKLPAIEGALEALEEMSQSENEIFICTSPILENPGSAQEKLAWVFKHLGESWRRKVIITKDKTLVKGDILIDDKPEIKGVCKASWRQFLYEQDYNEHITDKPRLNWKNWKEVLDI